jgi:chromosome segregation ATPase
MPEHDQVTNEVADQKSDKQRYEKEPVTASGAFFYIILSVFALVSPFYVLYVYHGFADSRISFEIDKKEWDRNKRSRIEWNQNKLVEANTLKAEINKLQSEFDIENKKITAVITELGFLKKSVIEEDSQLEKLNRERADSDSSVQANKVKLVDQQRRLKKLNDGIANLESDLIRSETQKSKLNAEVSKLKDDATYYEKDQAEADAKIRELRQQLAEIANDLLSTNEELLDKQSDLGSSMKAIEDGQRAALKLKSLESEIAILKGELDPLEKRLPVLNQQISQYLIERNELDSDIRQLRDDESSSQAELNKVRDAESKSRASLSAILENERLTKKQLQEVAKGLNTTKTEVEALKVSKNLLESQVSSLAKEKTQLSDDIQSLNKSKEDLQASLVILEKEKADASLQNQEVLLAIASAREQQSYLEAELSRIRSELDKASGNVQVLSDTEKQLQARIDTLKIENAELEERSISLKENLSEDLNKSLSEFLTSFNNLLKRVQQNAVTEPVEGGQ